MRVTVQQPVARRLGATARLSGVTTTGERRSLRLNVLATGGFTVVRGALAFAATLVITRGLATADRGAYSFVTGTTTVLLMLAGLGLSSAMTRVRATRSVGAQELYRASFLVGMVLGLAASAAYGIGFLLARDSLFEGITWQEALAVAVVLPPLLVLSHWTVVSYLDDRIVEVNLAYTIAGVLLLGAVSLIALAGELSAPLVVAAWALTGMLPLVLVIRPGRIRGLLASRQLASELVRYGLRANIATVALVLIWRLDVVLVKGYRGLDELAMYGVAVGLCEILLSVAVSTRVALTPRQGSHVDRAGLVAAIATVTRLTVATGVAGVIAVIVLAHPIVVGLFGARYAPAAGAMRWLIPGIVALVVQGPLLDYLLAEGKVRAVTVSALLAMALNLALNVALLPHHTFVAAAVASTAAYAVSSVLIVYLFVRTSGVSWSSLLVATPADLRIALRRSPA